ncbi:MAG: hypothetical protein ABIW83_10085 [Allosphingosinicella sp.]
MGDVRAQDGVESGAVSGSEALPEPIPRACPTGTPDEQKFPRFAASFHKLFQHYPAGSTTSPDLTGLLTDSGVANYENFRKALNGGPTGEPFDDCLLDGLTLLNRNPTAPPPCPGDPPLTSAPGPRVLVNPRSSKAISLNVAPFTNIDVAEILYRQRNQRQRLLGEISLSSEFSAADLVELYGQSLLRDQTLGQYSGPIAELVVKALNSFGNHFVWTYDASGNAVTAVDYPVTLANLFRGVCDAKPDSGTYLSGFLTLRRPPLFPSGCAAGVANLTRANTFARFGTLLEVVQGDLLEEFGVTVDQYASLQNSEIPRPYDCRHFDRTGVIRTGRHLGDYVHVDSAYEEYVRATDILIGMNIDRSPNSPYSRPSLNPNEGDGPTLGAPDAWAMVGAIRGEAERAAWTQKYLVARRARPEVMAALVHLAKLDPNHFLRNLLSPSFFAPGPVFDLLEEVKSRNYSLNGGEKNYLLPQMYPEGSPAHPAWTSGHATIAGACVTVIKAIFNNQVAYKVPAFGGEPNAAEITVKCDLDKVASNVAIGRGWGGVHYRSDGEHGILLGEQIAIEYLQNYIRTYAEEFRYFRGFQLIKRNGTPIRITPDCVIEGVPYSPAPAGFAAVEGADQGSTAGQYPASNL